MKDTLQDPQQNGAAAEGKDTSAKPYYPDGGCSSQEYLDEVRARIIARSKTSLRGKHMGFTAFWVLMLVIIMALFMLTTACSHSKKSDADQLQSVDVTESVMDSVTSYLDFPGVIHSRSHADVVGRVNGMVVRKFFTPGDKVHAGQALFAIENNIYRDEADRARAALASARSQMEYASRKYDAVKRGYDAEAVSQMDLLQAQNALSTAREQVNTAKANLSTALTNLGYCTVKAPISGTITEADYNEGSYINGQGAPVVLAHIYDENKFGAQFNVTALQYQQILAANGGVTAGIYSKVPVQFRAPVSTHYTTNLDYTSPFVDTQTGNLVVKGDVYCHNGELRDGMFCTISLPLGGKQRKVVVKDAALGTDQLGRYLYTVNDSNRIVYTPVKVGALVKDSLRVIESGLKPGVKYVTKALLKVRPGMEVKPVIKN